MDQLILLLIFFLIGLFSGLFKIAKVEDYKILADLAFYVFLPCSVLVSFATFSITSEILNSFEILIASLIAFSISLFIIAKAMKFEAKLTNAFYMCCTFGNIIFLGIPLSQVILGDSNLPLVSIFVAIHNSFIFGILFPLLVLFGADKKTSVKSGLSRIAKNTVVIAAIAGVISSAFRLDINIALPYLTNLSAMTTPISIIAMGIYFSQNIKIEITKELAIFTICKIVLMPLITIVFFFNSPYLKEALFLAIMPVAISNFSISQSLKLNKEKLVMDSIFVSTAISLGLVLVLKLAGIF
ncbi:AEC family transporter [Candidatus Micrarchaeota archaeon]|nr:AEC family transporter [Candidatus Micrarchaeota archaeon]